MAEAKPSMITANISFRTFSSYTGTPVPTDYKFVCWVGDKDEKRLLEKEYRKGREFIQVEIPMSEHNKEG